MAIERTVETDVYCDVCGEWIMGWKSNDVGVSRAWAAEYTRRRGGTVGKKIVCKIPILDRTGMLATDGIYRRRI